MKGHLQRLVRTVTKPEESVHPSVGSMFAPGQQDDFKGLQREELTTVTSARNSPEVITSASDHSSRASALSQTSLPLVRDDSSLSELLGRHVSPDSPQSRQSAYRESSFSEGVAIEPLITNFEISDTENMGRTNFEMPPQSGLQTAFPSRLSRSGGGADAATGSSASKKNDGHAGAKRVAPDRGADEIQIHIGRIEVTAIHPALTIPKTRDKEISLDAYLKRRDGRAG